MGMIKIHVEFLDGRKPEVHETPLNFPPGQEKQAVLQVLAGINAMGGVLDFETDGVSLTPISTIKLLKVTAEAASIIPPPGGIIVP